MKKAIIITATVLVTILQAVSQDTKYTQTYSNPLRVNPAILGDNTDLKITMAARQQWNIIEDGFKTYTLTAAYPLFIDKNKLDFGISIENNKEGAFSTLDALLSVGYTLQVGGNHYVNASIMGGFVQKSLTTANLTFDDQYVLGNYNENNISNESIPNEKLSYPDASFGMMWFYKPPSNGGNINAYFGFSAYHLNKPNESFTNSASKLPPLYSMQGGVKIIGSSKIDFTPNFKIFIQNEMEQLAGGLNMDYRFSEKAKFTIGTLYKRNNALAYLVGFEHKTFAFCYSYDMCTSDIKNYVTGLNTHEISLSLKINQKKETVSMF